MATIGIFRSSESHNVYWDYVLGILQLPALNYCSAEVQIRTALSLVILHFIKDQSLKTSEITYM